MAYDTLNPLGSKDPRDLYDNATNLDLYVNGPNPMYPNRFGALKLSLEGMNQEFNESQTGRQAIFQDFLNKANYTWIGDYAAGLNFVSRTQYFIRNGEKYVPENDLTLPYTTTGVWADEQSLFKLLAEDASLRQDLLSPEGATLVYDGAQSVSAKLATLSGKTDRIIGYAANAAEETSLFSQGYLFVVRTDLISPEPPAPVTDPYFANVTFLMQMDGTGTTFTDKKGHAIINNGGVTNAVFGGKQCARFTGGGYLTAGTSTDYDFGSGDFTIEFFASADSAALQSMIGNRSSSTTAGWQINRSATNTVLIEGGSFIESAAGAVGVNNLQHIAAVRASGTTKIFVEGTLVATGSPTFTFPSVQPLHIGNSAGQLPYSLTGYVGPIRITKGVARYAGAVVGTNYFTPPVSYPEA